MPRLALQVAGPVTSPSVVLDETSSSSKHAETLLFILGGMILLLVVLILIFVFRRVIRLSKLKTLFSNTWKRPVKNDILDGNFRSVSYFDFQTLKKATKNFHQNNLLGRGGFGPVYLGKLEDGKSVAIKKLSLDKSHQGESEFLAEVKMITSIQHKNLVRLVGCCSDGAQRLLVYEYMKNRSLNHIVYGLNDIYLNWNTRFQIMLGVARRLQYLHEDSHIRIVRRDIKVSNILLDEKYLPRIDDFG